MAEKEIKEEIKETAVAEEKETAVAEEIEAAVAEEKETAVAEEKETTVVEEPEQTAQRQSTENKRKKKAERREAKAARKAANIVEEKKTRPNNKLLALLIFGVVVGMFVFVGCYNYFSKPASIEKYLEDNGGAEAYGSMYVDEYSTADITAEGNNMKIEIKCAPPEESEKEMTDYYKGEDGEKQSKYLGAYFLTSMKPQVRGFSGNVNVIVNVNDKEVSNISMTNSEAKKFLKELEEEAEKEAAEAEDAGDEAAADDAGADQADADAAEEAAGDAAEEAADGAAAEGSAEGE